MSRRYIITILAVVMFLMLAYIGNVSARTAPTMSVYESEWFWAKSDIPIVIKHEFGKLPISIQVLVMPFGANTKDPTMGVPYTDWENGCATVEAVTTRFIYFHNGCGEDLYIKASAISYTP